ncbi:MAG: radical SAM protein, partial [Planctomycetes bacterium]|nr:radical SAM protein [Planctomycetota bacterium]
DLISSPFDNFSLHYALIAAIHRELLIDTASINMFKQANQANCIYIFLGVESGSEIILKKANKGYSRDEVIDKVTVAKEAGIAQVNISIIIGLPYETKDTIAETLNLIKLLPCDNAGINILDIYPGTAVFDMADRGEGGLRWIEGKRMNWGAYLRAEPMAEVNDVDCKYLKEARQKALRILAKKSRKKIISLYKKRWAYFKEFAKKDKSTLLRKTLDTLRNIK